MISFQYFWVKIGVGCDLNPILEVGKSHQYHLLTYLKKIKVRVININIPTFVMFIYKSGKKSRKKVEKITS